MSFLRSLGLRPQPLELATHGFGYGGTRPPPGTVTMYGMAPETLTSASLGTGRIDGAGNRGAPALLN